MMVFTTTRWTGYSLGGTKMANSLKLSKQERVAIAASLLFILALLEAALLPRQNQKTLKDSKRHKRNAT